MPSVALVGDGMMDVTDAPKPSRRQPSQPRTEPPRTSTSIRAVGRRGAGAPLTPLPPYRYALSRVLNQGRGRHSIATCQGGRENTEPDSEMAGKRATTEAPRRSVRDSKAPSRFRPSSDVPSELLEMIHTVASAAASKSKVPFEPGAVTALEEW